MPFIVGGLSLGSHGSVCMCLRVSKSSDVRAQTLRVPVSATEQEEVQVEVTRLLVEGYFALVRASLQDAVPKAVMHFLVMHVQRGMQQHLIRTLYRCEGLPEP